MEQVQAASNEPDIGIEFPNDIEYPKGLALFADQALDVFIQILGDDVAEEDPFWDKPEVVQMRELRRRLESPEGVTAMLGSAFLRSAGVREAHRDDIDDVVIFDRAATCQSTQVDVLRAMQAILNKILANSTAEPFVLYY